MAFAPVDRFGKPKIQIAERTGNRDLSDIDLAAGFLRLVVQGSDDAKRLVDL